MSLLTPIPAARSLDGSRAVSPDSARWAAEQVIRQHAEPPSDDRAVGRCRQCQPGGSCPMLAWALELTGALK